MTTFLQLHFLTSYPPACLNRDDLNRPKTGVMGGVPRLRIASQSLKRAWRTSDVFREKLTGQTGIRSKELGRKINIALLNGALLDELLRGKSLEKEADDKLTPKQTAEWAWMIASRYVDKKSKATDGEGNDSGTKEKSEKKKAPKSNVNKDTLKSSQIVFYSSDEIASIDKLIQQLREQRKAPTDKQLSEILIKEAGGAADLALFGRMLASSPDYNVEAACEVAHAITVHKVAVEDDFFTAVDDLNKHEEDAGSAHIGEQGFAAGLFYLYVCINRDLLIENLDRDNELVNNTIKALVEAAATVAPTGKQKSFASRAWASYILAEKGERQPRSLSVAFLKPIKSDDMLQEAIQKLEETRNRLDIAYYGHEKQINLPSELLNALEGKGNLNTVLNFLKG
ncbi:MAG TPA: type I-E CRISPR-associated protein Cas7/Cse4/CasC [Desulfatiglandales bacterium]|nr:type I-E CRISPR-associated protein Cas7/Cse4/CasC [Desulfatiglandales bacterium]